VPVALPPGAVALLVVSLPAPSVAVVLVPPPPISRDLVDIAFFIPFIVWLSPRIQN
jgi:hypothetical protein